MVKSASTMIGHSLNIYNGAKYQRVGALGYKHKFMTDPQFLGGGIGVLPSGTSHNPAPAFKTVRVAVLD